METLSVATRSRCEMRDITAQVRELVARGRQQGRRNGALLLFSPHTTCGLTINEGADPDVRRDMVRFFSAMVPQDADFDHAEGNSDAHIKTTLHGPSLMLIVEDGQLQLGR